jgi:type I restriction enzyme M protein
MNQGTWAICKMNMFLHSVFNADIKKGDTIRDPKHLKEGELMTFDRVIANPPFSLKKWGKNIADRDSYGRFKYGTPPKDYGDLAFVQHMIASLNANGIMGVVVPHGVLFRGGSEKTIRIGLLEDDLIEGIIGLPENLFYGTSIEACILILNKNKPKEKRNKILFINSEFEFDDTKTKNRLKEKDIQKILNTYKKYLEISIPKTSKKYNRFFSRVISKEEIITNDFNLNIRRYANASPPLDSYDEKGIVESGIPISEINDEYNLEVLEDFNLKIVLEKKNDNYYQFKKEIKTKSELGKLIKINNYKIYDLINNWWDKYRFSIKEIDENIKNIEKKISELSDN